MTTALVLPGALLALWFFAVGLWVYAMARAVQ